MPYSAALPVPTMIAVGVARPERAGAGDDQHGDRRLVRAAGQTPASGPKTSQPTKVSAASTSTAGTK